MKTKSKKKVEKGFLEEVIEERTEKNPAFPAMVELARVRREIDLMHDLLLEHTHRLTRLEGPVPQQEMASDTAEVTVAAQEVPVVRFIKFEPDAIAPQYMSKGAAAVDLYAAVAGYLVPGQRLAASVGIGVEIPTGWEGQIRPRSGSAIRDGLGVINSPGTIDSDFRGEVMVLLVNLGNQLITWERGERIAQMVIAPAVQAEFVQVKSLSDTNRGSGGLGSTGR